MTILSLLPLLCAAGSGLPEEVRAVWSSWGQQAGRWAEVAPDLAGHSINMVLPNMMYGCVAAFDTDLIPVSPLFAEYGDILEQCIDACAGQGIQVHVWVVLWKRGRNQEAYIESMQAAGMTQVSATGAESEWLCPGDPDNRELMLELIREMAVEYPVDGIHLDYIRYPNTRHCFCDGCRRRFSAEECTTIRSWPAQVLEGGRYRGIYLAWRTEQITSFVRNVHEMLLEEAPDVVLSAAVLPDRENGLDNGQDWVSWTDEGIIDFVVPMNYTDSLELFEEYLSSQSAAADGFPLVAGIGALASGLDLTPEDILAQISLSAELGTRGFSIYHLNRTLIRDRLPEIFPLR